jgi:hypothetical protein
MKSGKPFEHELKAIKHDNDAFDDWVDEYGSSFSDNYQYIFADSLFESVLCDLKNEIESEDFVLNPKYISELFSEKIDSSEDWIYVCDFNDAIVVYHGNPGGMHEVYSGLAIYENIDEFFGVYSLSGCLFPGSIHSEDDILSMFLKYLVAATTKK